MNKNYGKVNRDKSLEKLKATRLTDSPRQTTNAQHKSRLIS